MSGRWQRIGDLAQALRLKREQLDPALRWTPAELAAHQERRWRAVARRAAERAPFYRELYRGIDLERAPLTELPPIEKGQLMERFDESVTEPALRLADLEAYLRAAPPDGLFRGRFQVLLTSGTTGQRGILVYDRPEWHARIAASFRCQELMGSRRRLIPRPSMATFSSTNPFHISCRLARAADVGLYRKLAVDPQEPLERALPRLERFRPEVLFGYPSVILPVAQAAIDGRVRLRPQRVIAGAEAVTPAFRATIRAAWACEVFDLYATTETGALAVEGTDHRGSYLMEDQTIVEVVDEQDRPVPDGTRGHHLLLTCLDRLTQPLIRYRISDQIIVDPPAPAAPGAAPRPLPFRRVRAIDGRVRDALRLLHRQGHEVELRPSFLLAGVLALPGARQARVVQEPEEIRVSMVAATAQAAGLPAAVEQWFQGVAREQDLRLPPIVVEIVPRLGGSEGTMGKFRPVECRLPERQPSVFS
jgi:phenylacetate-CoA ligase